MGSWNKLCKLKMVSYILDHPVYICLNFNLHADFAMQIENRYNDREKILNINLLYWLIDEIDL